MAIINENAVTSQGLPAYGSAVLVNIINEMAYCQLRISRIAICKSRWYKWWNIGWKYLKKKDPCFRCPIGCGRYCEVDGIEGSGPEYETIWGFGSDCGVSDLGAIIKANYWCNEYGLDTISASSTIAAAIGTFMKKVILKKKT